MTYKHLHIGSNNAIGRALALMPDVICCSHNEVNDIEFFNFEFISISAFDPIKKTRLVEDPVDFIKMVSRFPKSTKIVYFSTARIFDESTEKNRSIYVKNKHSEESILSSLFKDLSIFFLPNLIPQHPADNSPFFNRMKKNYANNFVHFDVTPESTWNFIYPSDISKALLRLESALHKQILLSETSTSAAQMVEELLSMKDLNVIYSGNKTHHYPNRGLCPEIFTMGDAGQNSSWIRNIMELRQYD
jgi:hypothetical protein